MTLFNFLVIKYVKIGIKMINRLDEQLQDPE